MDRWHGKLAIVTGAGSGIGESISKALVHKGLNVLGLDRIEERLQELSKGFEACVGSFYFMRCDVTKEQDILNAFKYAENIFGAVDILINNVGIIKYCSFQETTTSDFRAIIDTNFLAAAICTRETLKLMRKHENMGHIININSILGRNSKGNIGNPVNVYPATKYALRAMTDNVRLEIAEKKDMIRLTSIYPGLVKTNIINDFDEKYKNIPFLNGSDIADSVIFALSVPPNVQIEEIVVTALHNII